MLRRQLNTLLLILTSSVSAPAALAAAPVCGVIESFSGDIQILDAERTRLIPLVSKGEIPCGSWILTKAGWIEWTETQRNRFRLAPEGFVEVSQAKLNLVRGQIFAHGPKGNRPVQVLTANGEIQFPGGTSLLAYRPATEETQIMVLDGQASLKNRYLPGSKNDIFAGRTSTLRLTDARVIPSPSARIQITALKEITAPFAMDEHNRDVLIAMASRPATTKEVAGGRTLASVPGDAVKSDDRAAKSTTHATDSDTAPAPVKTQIIERKIGSLPVATPVAKVANPIPEEARKRLILELIRLRGEGED